MHAVPAERGNLAGHLHEHASGGTERDHRDGKPLVHALEPGEDGKARDDHDVVQNGREIAPEVIAMRVENAREYRTQTVEQHLKSEDAEEVDRRVHLGPVTHERLRPDEPRREDDREHRHAAEHDEQNRKKVAHIVICRLTPAVATSFKVDRQERRHEHAAHHQLVEHVGKVVRDVVGRGEVRDAEGDAHDPCAHKARHARDDDEPRHEPRGTADALVITGTGKVLVVV